MGGVNKWSKPVQLFVRTSSKPSRHRREQTPNPRHFAQRNMREWKRASNCFRAFLGIVFAILVLNWVQSLYGVGSIISHFNENECQGDAAVYRHEGSHAVFPQAQDRTRCFHPAKVPKQFGSGELVFGTVKPTLVAANRKLLQVQSLNDVGSISHSVETRRQGGAGAYQLDGTHAVFSQAQYRTRCLRPSKVHSTQSGSGNSVFDVKQTRNAINRKMILVNNGPLNLYCPSCGAVDHLANLSNVSSHRSDYTERGGLIDRAFQVRTLYSRTKLAGLRKEGCDRTTGILWEKKSDFGQWSF